MGIGIKYLDTCSEDILFTTYSHTTISTLSLTFHWLLRTVVDLPTRIMPKSIAERPKLIDVLKDRYECPHFRILIVGRANAGKTTIVEKMCNVKQGTIPIVYDRHGVEISLTPSEKPTSSWRRVFRHGSDSGKNSSILAPSIYVSFLEYCSSEMNADGILERRAWYRAPDYLSWEQLHIPWLTGFRSWRKGWTKDCEEVHQGSVFCLQVEGPATRNLVLIYAWLITLQWH